MGCAWFCHQALHRRGQLGPGAAEQQHIINAFAFELGKAGIDPAVGYPGVHVVAGGINATGEFIDSIGKHRSFERETDRPLV